MRIVFALVLAALCCTSISAVTRTISAFNIQVFGPTKAGKEDVMNELCQILKRYDIVLIQEIRNADGTAIVELLNQLNAESDVNNAYAMEIGPRVGRTSSKEQYCYFYRTDNFEIPASPISYTYPDNADTFEREPFQTLFSDKSTGTEFVLSALHAKPDDAPAELGHLDTVYDNIVSYYGTESVIFLGDFNADCSYVTASEMAVLDFRHDSRFTWYIPDEADTTVSTTDCAYDRFVTAGAIDDAVVSSEVFNFETVHGLTNKFAKDVSDHYPIEMTLTY